MDGLEAYDVLINFFDNIDILMLIFVRVLGFLMLIPILSSQNMFTQGRLFFALVMALALFMSGNITSVYYVALTPMFVYLTLLEFLVGLVMGYMVFAVFNLIFFAGHLMDFSIGLMMVNTIDPMTQTQVPVTGNIFYLALVAMLVATGGLHQLFLAFFYSYAHLPIGAAVVMSNPDLFWYIVLVLAESMILAIRIAMPLVGTMMIINVALGIMVKTSPQMNIFVVGMPIRILVGLFLIFAVMAPSLGAIFANVFDMAALAMREVIWGMRPS
ncbi:MAG: flagellar biosynthetic protein FliR [Turicibacter sp.]|nr:flagellar biosynthetic protein FliR [Turicibacter sp.]